MSEVRYTIEVEVDKFGYSNVGGNHFRTLQALRELSKKGYKIKRIDSENVVVTR